MPTKPTSKTLWSNLDHTVWKKRAHWPSFKKLLIALSGGLDSMALLSVFSRLARAGSFEIFAVNVHHGPGPQEDWRHQAQVHCQTVCENLGIDFFSAGPSKVELRSEADLRVFRYQELEKIRLENQCEFILTAHHADDLFETRFLRLLRGTGPQGLEAMSEFEGPLWRPFLEIPRADLIAYVKQNLLIYVDDPSNECSDPMRNWLRHELFPSIEARQSGLVRNLGRSLQLLVDSLASEMPLPLTFLGVREIAFSREEYHRLSSIKQRQLLAGLIHKLGLQHYSQGQIEEIQKRLDNIQKVHTFQLGNLCWHIDAWQVRAKA